MWVHERTCEIGGRLIVVRTSSDADDRAIARLPVPWRPGPSGCPGYQVVLSAATTGTSRAIARLEQGFCEVARSLDPAVVLAALRGYLQAHAGVPPDRLWLRASAVTDGTTAVLTDSALVHRDTGLERQLRGAGFSLLPPPYLALDADSDPRIEHDGLVLPASRWVVDGRSPLARTSQVARTAHIASLLERGARVAAPSALDVAGRLARLPVGVVATDGLSDELTASAR